MGDRVGNWAGRMPARRRIKIICPVFGTFWVPLTGGVLEMGRFLGGGETKRGTPYSARSKEVGLRRLRGRQARDGVELGPGWVGMEWSRAPIVGECDGMCRTVCIYGGRSPNTCAGGAGRVGSDIEQKANG